MEADLAAAFVQAALATVFEHRQILVMYHTAPEYVCATTIIDHGDLGIRMGVLVTYMAMCTTHARDITTRTGTKVT